MLAAIVSLLGIQLGLGNLTALAVGAIAFVAELALHFWYGRRAIAAGVGNYEPLFPTD